MTGPERPPGGLPAWPTIPPADETPPTAPVEERTDATPAPVEERTDATPEPVEERTDTTPEPVEEPTDTTPEPERTPAPEPAVVPAPTAPAAAAPEPPSPPSPAQVTPGAPAARPPAATPPVVLTKPEAAREAAEVPPAAPPAARGRWLAVAALGLAVVLLAVASFVLVGKDRDQSERADRLIALAAVQDPVGPALRAAATAVETLLSYDYTRLDADFAAGQQLLTPAFAAKYGDFTDKLVRPSALEAKGRVVAKLQVLAPTEASLADRVVVLAFVDQTTTSALLKAPAVDQSRVTLTLVPRGGSWLVCNLVVTGSKPDADSACVV